jgi:hypothetical protein
MHPLPALCDVEGPVNWSKWVTFRTAGAQCTVISNLGSQTPFPMTPWEKHVIGGCRTESRVPRITSSPDIASADIAESQVSTSTCSK